MGFRKEWFLEGRDNRLLSFAYTSNPNRGLLLLLDWWGEIEKIAPGAELNIYYGWESTSSWSQDPNWQKSIADERAAVMTAADRSGVVS